MEPKQKTTANENTTAANGIPAYGTFQGYGPSPDDDETEIDLADMFAKILRGWKTVLVWMIVLAAIVGAAGSYRNYLSIQNEYTDQSRTALEENLTNTQLENVTQMYQRYRSYRQRIVNNQYYMEHSLKMKLDANNVSRYKVEYMVESTQQNVLSSISGFALNYEDYTKIADILGGDADPRYAYELVSIYGDTNQESYDIDADGGNDALKGSVSNTYKGMLTVSIIGGSKDACYQIAEVADAAIQRHYQKLTENGISVQISQIDDQYTEYVDTDLANQQQDAITENSDLIQEYNTFENDAEETMSEEELALFQYLIGQDDHLTEHVHWKRYVAIGALAGLIIGIVLIIIKYITKSGFHTPDDAMRRTNLTVLGAVHSDEKKRHGLDRLFCGWARKIELRDFPPSTQEQELRAVCARVIAICMRQNYHSVYLAHGFFEGAPAKLVDEIRQTIASHVQTVKAGSPAFDDLALQELEDADCAVFLVSVENSRLYAIEQNKAAARDLNVPVLGEIIL